MFRRAASIACLLACSGANAQQRSITLDPAAGTATEQRTTESRPSVDRRLLDIARRLLAEDEPERARRLLDDWIDRNNGIRDVSLGEALRLRGDAKLAMDQEFNALFDYERVIREFPGTPDYIIAVEREVDIGTLYLGGLKQRLLGLRIESSIGTAQELLLRAQERVPGSRLAERSAITLADFYYRTQRLDLARDMYDIILRTYPNSPFRKRAMRNRIFATIAGYKGPAYDGLRLVDARVLIEEFAAQYPAEADRALLSDALLSRIDESAGAQQLVVARWYMANDDNAAAAHTLRRLLRDYPATVAAARALQILQQQGWLEGQQTADASGAAR